MHLINSNVVYVTQEMGKKVKKESRKMYFHLNVYLPDKLATIYEMYLVFGTVIVEMS